MKGINQRLQKSSGKKGSQTKLSSLNAATHQKEDHNNNHLRTYKPTAMELSQAIQKILDKQEHLEWHDVHDKVERKHPTWVLHDRRVAKYVKRHHAQTKMLAAEQESPSGVGSWDRFFFRRKPRGTSPPNHMHTSSSSSPRTPSSIDLLHPTPHSPHPHHGIRSVELVPMGALPPVTPLETFLETPTTIQVNRHRTNNQHIGTPLEARNLSSIYSDDNDPGTKERGCWCES